METEEALHYKKLKNGVVQCSLCPWFCVLKNEQRGNCKVRLNRGGKLYTLVYGNPCSANVDPIEKKPLFHFLPGSNVYSVGTAGCNLKCKFCQNWTLSQSNPEDIASKDLSPAKVVENALKTKCKSIAYTYTEPTIFYEYVFDTAKIAKRKGLKNVMVTNGYINPEPIKQLYPLIDAVNVDLKGFTDNFYTDIVGAKLKPVLETLKLIQKQGTFIEITNLLIPGLNDNVGSIKKMCDWIVKNLGKDVPLHFSRFFPDYQLQHIPPTHEQKMYNAREIALKKGMQFVYIGNMIVDVEDDTFCTKCGKVVIERDRFNVVHSKLKEGKCDCGNEIPGVW